MSEEIKAALEAGLTGLATQLKTATDAYNVELEKHGKVGTELTGKIDELSGHYKELRDEFTALARLNTPASGAGPSESAGQEFVKSDAYALLAKGEREKVRFEVKNTVGSLDNTVQPQQMPGIIPGSFAPRTVRQQMPTILVASNSVNSLRENVWTNDAAEVAEKAAKPESDITFSPYNVIIETIAHWIKISKQLMDDAPAVASYIDTRLRDGLAQRVERQLILGNGTTPQISGLTDAGNFTAFTPTSGANLVESINKAKYNRWAVGEVVDTVIVNPADWAAIEVLREGAGSGMYLYGAPGTMAGTSPFGVDVVMSQYMTAGSFVIGSLRSSAVIYQRQGAVVEMGYVDDDFTKNLVTIRAEERLGLGVERPVGIMFGDITAA